MYITMAKSMVDRATKAGKFSEYAGIIGKAINNIEININVAVFNLAHNYTLILNIKF